MASNTRPSQPCGAKLSRRAKIADPKMAVEPSIPQGGRGGFFATVSPPASILPPLALCSEEFTTVIFLRIELATPYIREESFSRQPARSRHCKRNLPNQKARVA